MNKAQTNIQEQLNNWFEAEAKLSKFQEDNKNWFDLVEYWRIKDDVKNAKNNLIYIIAEY